MRTRIISGRVDLETYNLVEKRVKELELKDKTSYIRYLLSKDLNIDNP